MDKAPEAAPRIAFRRMHPSVPQQPEDSAAAAPPERLHIYYLRGRVHPGELRGDPDFLGVWQEDDELSFLFFTQPADSRVRELLRRHPRLRLLDSYEMGYAQWHGDIPAVMRRGGLTFVPAWQAGGCGSQDRIVFDPGVVFGAGNHQTTLDCLQGLARMARREEIRTALDLGTGSGLLALAAARLGCGRVLAIDLNPLAAETAFRNVRANNLSGRVLVCRGRAEEATGIPADLLMANLHFDVLSKIVRDPGFRSAKLFLLSGLLPSQAAEIRGMLSRMGARIEQVLSGDGIWHTIAGAFPAPE